MVIPFQNAHFWAAPHPPTLERAKVIFKLVGISYPGTTQVNQNMLIPEKWMICLKQIKSQYGLRNQRVLWIQTTTYCKCHINEERILPLFQKKYLNGWEAECSKCSAPNSSEYLIACTHLNKHNISTSRSYSLEACFWFPTLTPFPLKHGLCLKTWSTWFLEKLLLFFIKWQMALKILMTSLA